MIVSYSCTPNDMAQILIVCLLWKEQNIWPHQEPNSLWRQVIFQSTVLNLLFCPVKSIWGENPWITMTQACLDKSGRKLAQKWPMYEKVNGIALIERSALCIRGLGHHHQKISAIQQLSLQSVIITEFEALLYLTSEKSIWAETFLSLFVCF